MGGEETGVTRIDEEYSAGERLLFAGERSSNRAQSEFAERRELSVRTRSRSRNDLARVAARGRIDSRNRRRKLRRKRSAWRENCRRILRMFALSYEKCDRVLGLTIEPKTVDEILGRFGLNRRTKSESASKQKSKDRPGRSRVIDGICGAMSI